MNKVGLTEDNYMHEAIEVLRKSEGAVIYAIAKNNDGSGGFNQSVLSFARDTDEPRINLMVDIIKKVTNSTLSDIAMFADMDDEDMRDE